METLANLIKAGGESAINTFILEVPARHTGQSISSVLNITNGNRLLYCGSMGCNAAYTPAMTLQGSNDGSTWTQIDGGTAYGGYAYATGDIPADYAYYRLIEKAHNGYSTWCTFLLVEAYE